MSRYRKIPVVINAVIYDASPSCLESITKLFGKSFEEVEIGGQIKMVIPTLEGDHFASKGDFIIQGVQGEAYPCKPDIFHMTYESV